MAPTRWSGRRRRNRIDSSSRGSGASRRPRRRDGERNGRFRRSRPHGRRGAHAHRFASRSGLLPFPPRRPQGPNYKYRPPASRPPQTPRRSSSTSALLCSPRHTPLRGPSKNSPAQPSFLFLRLHRPDRRLSLIGSGFTQLRESGGKLLMTKQGAVVPVGEAAVAVPPNPAPLFQYPPPRAAPPPGVAVRRKYLQVGGAGAGRVVAAAAGGLVESMRASSPTHAKAAAALAAGVDEERYAAWQARHPSALGKFDQVVAASKGKQIVVFLDYDGTLSPIVDDPDAAYMSDTMRRAVRSVAKHFPTAIVSGRCRDKVFEFVKLAELYYAGSHGMDIKGPAKGSRHTKAAKVPIPIPPPLPIPTHLCSCSQAKLGDTYLCVCGSQAKGVLFQPASQFLPMIEQVHQSLIEKTKCIPGAKVENNKFCVSVHFRCVDEKSWGTLAEIVKSVLADYPKLKLTQGRMVFEVRPTIKWDKGKALEFLLDSLGFSDCTHVLPVYIGDDRTDEDAFKVLRKRGHGVGILVSKHPKDTSASFSLQEPAEASRRRCMLPSSMIYFHHHFCSGICDGVPAAARRVGAPLQGPPQVVISIITVPPPLQLSVTGGAQPPAGRRGD
ncbi:hypothetical protein U9M48_039063 [Paspalum notatum var. saurae]|uniref:trehalose-phosphatase n=1 Tax=Paspalum notatum var. saurae TaxID=547442 RepID=A0AAQ3UN60_PASNO